MNRVFGFSGNEWFSLALIFLFAVLAITGLQQVQVSEISITGPPHYIDNIGKNSLKNPLSVAYFRGKILVTSSSESKVKIFSQSGAETGSIKLPAKSYPASLAVNDDGVAYIGDLATKSVFKSSLGYQPYKVEKIKLKTKQVQPLAMAFHQGRLLLFDGLSQKLKFLKDDQTLADFTSDRKLSFSYANGIYGDGDNLYIADSNGRRIVRLSSTGAYQATLKNFSLPRGVAVDKFKRLHVVDTFSHSVKVYSSKGQLAFSYGNEGSQEGQLYFPNGLAIDSRRNRIYIADRGNSRVQVWGW